MEYIQNSLGCDSTHTLNLTINNSNTGSSFETACDSYTWEGVVYTSSGTYTNTYINLSGCDSVHTLNLNIYPSLTAYIDQLGDSLFAITNPIGLNANWYNTQTENGNTRIWLMQENITSFAPTFECSYFIVVNQDGCTDTSDIYYFGATAKRIGDLEVSPNPTKDLVNVKFDNTNNQYVYLHLMDNRGIKLDDFMTKEAELDIDMTKYPSGTYYLYFDSRFVKQGCNQEDVEMISTKIILNK